MQVQPPSYIFQEELYYFTSPVIIVLRKPWSGYAVEDQTLLQKILTSVKVDVNAVRVVVQPAVKLASLLSMFPERVLIFGSETDEDLSSYKVVAVHGFTVIRAADLDELNDEAKKSLWVGLRQMFGL